MVFFFAAMEKSFPKCIVFESQMVSNSWNNKNKIMFNVTELCTQNY